MPEFKKNRNPILMKAAKGGPIHKNYASPVKETGKMNATFTKTKIKTKDDKYPNLKDGNKDARADTVLAGLKNYHSFQYISKENKKKVTDAIGRLGGYKPTIKEMKRQFKKKN